MDMYRKVKSQKSKVKNKGGFTLLEVVVALAILSGVIVTALITLHYHISVTDRTMAIITATNLAKEKFEEIRISAAPALSEGDFAPYSPEFRWKIPFTESWRSAYPYLFKLLFCEIGC